MKEFKYYELPDDMKKIVDSLYNMENPNVKLELYEDPCQNTIEFKVNTTPDPEYGNIHVPLATYFVKQGAHKGEVVLIVGI